MKLKSVTIIVGGIEPERRTKAVELTKGKKSCWISEPSALKLIEKDADFIVFTGLARGNIDWFKNLMLCKEIAIGSESDTTVCRITRPKIIATSGAFSRGKFRNRQHVKVIEL